MRATKHILAIGLIAQLVPFSLEAESVVVILNSGSTNTVGYRIELERSGDATYTPLPHRLNPETSRTNQPKRVLLPRTVVQRFYDDLQRAQPLTSLPRYRCLKSASFGSTLVIRVGDQETPDLACGDGGSKTLRSLIQDVNEIVKSMTSK